VLHFDAVVLGQVLCQHLNASARLALINGGLPATACSDFDMFDSSQVLVAAVIQGA
jgi:hypothetical protein